MSNSAKYIVYLISGIIVILLVQSAIPKPVNWNPSYKTADKIPYGLYILDHELPHLLQPAKIKKYPKTVYEYYKEELDTVKPIKETWFFADDKLQLDTPSVNQLLKAVEAGNDVFIFSNNIPANLLDSLKLTSRLTDPEVIRLTNPNLKASPFRLDVLMSALNVHDTAQITVLGTIGNSPNYIRKKIGKGNLYLHTNAILLTNYHLLESNTHLYAEGALSYINTAKVVWFDNKAKAEGLNQSPLRYILQNKELRWAWYLLLISVILFTFFYSRRKQRVIPIMLPLENKSVDFAKTIANLYYQEKDYNDLMHKMIIYFLDHVRNQWRLDTSKLDAQFIENLHLKSQKSKEEVSDLVQQILNFKNSSKKHTETDVNTLYKSIEKIMEL